MIARKRLKPEAIQIRVTKAMKERLIAEADAKEKTVVGVVEEALRQYFEEKPSLDDSLKQLAGSLKKLEERVAVVEQQLPRKKK
jgi:Tfp pilus assembly protein PilO